jgi:thiamine biosynthesis lipoprotein
VRFDTGGSGKGLAADALAHQLADYERAIIDCAGDVRLSGPGFAHTPMHVTLRHPLTGRDLAPLAPRGGSVATSGIDSRVWRRQDGSYAHHLIDPSTGQPAWTGLVAATAVAPTALEAETLTTMALLLGPEGAREVLAEHGGIAYGDDGGVELIGPIGRLQVRGSARPALRVRLPR